jgi:hypothetical protein
VVWFVIELTVWMRLKLQKNITGFQLLYFASFILNSYSFAVTTKVELRIQRCQQLILLDVHHLKGILSSQQKRWQKSHRLCQTLTSSEHTQKIMSNQTPSQRGRLGLKRKLKTKSSTIFPPDSNKTSSIWISKSPNLQEIHLLGHWSLNHGQQPKALPLFDQEANSIQHVAPSAKSIHIQKHPECWHSGRTCSSLGHP